MQNLGENHRRLQEGSGGWVNTSDELLLLTRLRLAYILVRYIHFVNVDVGPTGGEAFYVQHD